MNHLQYKLLEQCTKRRMSVEDTLTVMQGQRELCKKMLAYADTCFARKTYKKSVMVSANYGGTQMNSRQDVLAQLKAADSGILKVCSPGEITLLCNMVFWSMEAGVPSAMRFLGYFRKLLAFVLKHKDEITFRNPLTGFPVCLKVYDEESIGVKFRVHGKIGKARVNVQLKTTNKRKTTSSSVPSIIHNIDASILVLIKEGLDMTEMAYIHDSVATHPNLTTKAKQAVSQTLVQVLEGDIFQNIVDQLLEGIEDVPVNLRKAPSEGTWTEYSEDDWYYAFS